MYELAKELGLANKELVAAIRALGIEVNNHMSSLAAGDVAQVRRSVARGGRAPAPGQRQRVVMAVGTKPSKSRSRSARVAPSVEPTAVDQGIARVHKSCGGEARDFTTSTTAFYRCMKCGKGGPTRPIELARTDQRGLPKRPRAPSGGLISSFLSGFIEGLASGPPTATTQDGCEDEAHEELRRRKQGEEQRRREEEEEEEEEEDEKARRRRPRRRGIRLR